jgi:hypothetical protein
MRPVDRRDARRCLHDENERDDLASRRGPYRFNLLVAGDAHSVNGE